MVETFEFYDVTLVFFDFCYFTRVIEKSIYFFLILQPIFYNKTKKNTFLMLTISKLFDSVVKYSVVFIWWFVTQMLRSGKRQSKAANVYVYAKLNTFLV